MFIKNIMTKNTVTVSPETSLAETLTLLRNQDFEGVPVFDKSQGLCGVITIWDLLLAAADSEPSYMESTPVKELMTASVVTVEDEEIVEEAAYIMHKHDINLLPVVDRVGNLVGILTEADLFSCFVSMLGLTEKGTRLTLQVPNKVGQLAAVTAVIRNANVSIASLATFETDKSILDVVVRLKTIDAKPVVEALRNAGFRVIHVSQIWE